MLPSIRIKDLARELGHGDPNTLAIMCQYLDEQYVKSHPTIKPRVHLSPKERMKEFFNQRIGIEYSKLLVLMYRYGNAEYCTNIIAELIEEEFIEPSIIEGSKRRAYQLTATATEALNASTNNKFTI